MSNMDRKAFIEDVIEKVRSSVPITSVVETKVRLVNKSGYYKGICLFHNDRHIGSFVVSDKKQIFKCFSCGTGGDSIKFIKLSEGINYVESAMKIALSNNIITKSENDEFFEKKYSDKKAEKLEKIYTKKDNDKFKTIIAPNDVLNKVFTAFIKENPLSNEHKEYLLGRELSEESIINGGYFTFQSKRNSKLIMKGFLNTLKIDYGYSQDILRDVPGFYREKATNTYTFSKNNGIGIPIRNANGLIVGIQIRNDEEKTGRSRYIWFSSSWIENTDKLIEQFDCATSAGSPLDVMFPSGKPSQAIFITEGRFKAQIIAEQFHSVAISVQGVGNWRNISEQVKIIQKKYPDVNFKAIYVAFDADMAYNTQVFNQAMNMTNNLKKEVGQIPSGEKDKNGKEIYTDILQIYYVMWAVDYGKGIDDLIIEGHKGMVEAKDKDTFDGIYSKFIEGVKEKYPDTDINDIPKEYLKEYFDATVMIKENFKKITDYIQSYVENATKNVS